MTQLSYGVNHLVKQQVILGERVADKLDLRKGHFYCIVDHGLDEWNGGYRYKGIVDGKHYFEDMLSVGNENPIILSTEELDEYITNGAIAWEN